jgi:hypothetical protein
VLCDLLLKYKIETLNPIFVQTRKSHFIDSHYMDIWSGGGGAMRTVDLRGGADRQFESKVVHQIKNDKQRGNTFSIDGFMACLKWYTCARLEVYEDRTINGRDTIECTVYGPADNAA